MSLRTTAAKGFAFESARVIVVSVVTTVRIIILARLLAPDALGLFALAVAQGIKVRSYGWARKTQKLSIFRLKAFALSVLLALGGYIFKPQRLFHYRYRLNNYDGLLYGATARSFK